MRIVFAGTPDFAAQHLSHLLDTDFDIVGVYTQPDRPAGRGKQGWVKGHRVPWLRAKEC